ncbi:MAG: hypothetical protein HC921_22440 [Synechococcaceae cyanobacterium SM2_3_1]|nr:hypothetical protein [Synechococcaceae cyanobacterium SM2_3_1]
MTNTVDEQNDLVLLDYVKAGDLVNVKAWIHANKSLDSMSHMGYPSLDAAVQSGSKEIVQFLLESGFKVDFLHPLYEAIMLNSIEMVQLLIEYGADIERCWDEGITPILAAVVSGNSEIVRILVEAGADVNKTDKYGISPIMEAAQMGRQEVYEYLVPYVSSDEYELSRVARLIGAAGKGQLSMIQRLIEDGLDVDSSDLTYLDGETPLHAALVSGQYSTAKALLELGANIEARDFLGLTYLMVAAQEHNADIVQLLIEQGSNVNARDNNGNTAIMLAIGARAYTDLQRRARILTTNLLLKSGAALDAVNAFGQTAIDLARESEDSELIKLLMKQSNY